MQSFTLEVTVPNRAPVAQDDVYSVEIDDVLTVDAAAGLLANDTDPDDDDLALDEIIDPPSNGRVETNDDGSFTYTPRRPGATDILYPDIDLTRFSLAGIEASSTQSGFPAENLLDGFGETRWVSDDSAGMTGTITLSFDSPVTPTTLELIGIRGTSADTGLGLQVVDVELLDADDDVILKLAGQTFPTNPAGDGRDADLVIDLVPAGGSAPAGVRTVVIDVVETDGGPPGLGGVILTGEGPSRNLSPDIEWSWTDPTFGAGMVSPTVGDLDGDLDGNGVPEVLFLSAPFTSAPATSARLFALDGGNGLERWSSAANAFSTISSPVLGDLDNDGRLEVVAVAANRRFVVVLNHLGEERVRFDTGGNLANLALADLDGDGVPEIVSPITVSGQNTQVVALTVATDPTTRAMTIAERWRTTGAGGCGAGAALASNWCVPAIADIDLDGEPEIVMGNRIVDADGQVEHTSGLPDGFVAIGNFDDDPEGEIVHVELGKVRLLDHDLTVLWGPRAIPGISSGPPTVGDFDSDGQPEIGVAGATRYVVLDTDGTELWQRATVDASSGFTGSTIFDFDNDGTTEVVYRDEQNLWIFDGPTGAVRSRTPMRSLTLIEYPIVADIDADGQAEIVVPSDDDTPLPDGTTQRRGLYTFEGPLGDWVRARPIWNQHSYHVTNVNADGTIPAVESPNWLDPRLNNYRENAFPQDEISGLDRFTYRVSDGVDVDEAVAYIDIRDPENAPEITCLPATTAVVGFDYSSRVCAIDADEGDTLTYALDGGPSVDPATGVVTWVPTAAELGNRPVTVTVTDSTGRFATRTLTLTVVAPVTVPDVVGAEQADARSDVEGAGLTVGDVETAADPVVPAGQVLAQDPVAGAAAAPGSEVDLVVSSGPAPGDEDVDFDTFSPNQGDCNDTNPAIYPGATEVDGDGVDSDCDGFDGAPPVLERLDVSPTTPVIRVGETFALGVRAVFDDETTADVTSLGEWTSLSLGVVDVDSRGRISGVAAGSGTIRVAYRGVSREVAVTVRAPATPDDGTPPTAAISAPVAGAEVTGPVDVIGSATDAELLRWTLELVDGDVVVTQVATSTGGVEDNVLGRLDPTMLINGSYELVLTVVDVTGNTSTSRQPITITGQMKVGTFALSFTDLVVPAPGLPIEVRRDYDTRDDELGDFGYGWRLGLSNLQVTSSGSQGQGWELTRARFSYLLQPLRPHTITIVLPDGTTEEFDATTTPSATAFVPPQTAVMSYRARPETRGSLEPTGNRNVLVFNGSAQGAELVDDTTFRTWEPQGFRYTTADGTVFAIDADGAVRSIVEPNGNVVTISRNGITHSAGSSVVFQRDALDRIVAIVDQAGNRQTYTYDAIGDLVAHTDAEGAVTRFRYTGLHDIVEIVGAGGIGIRRLDYDDDGRLIGFDDGDGYVVEFAHDIDTRREVITDANGNPNVIGYDDRGNVVEQIDAEGRTSSFSYDANGNLLTRERPGLGTESFTYDALDRVLEAVDGAGATTTYTYDGTAQRIATVTDPLGDVTSFTYDAAGQVLTRTSPTSNAAYSYDSSGLLRTATVDGATSTYDYDSRGNLIAEALPDGSTNAFEVNGAGAVTAVVTVDGRTELEVNGNGLPVGVTTPSGDVSTLSYGPTGLLTGVTTPDGTTVVETLDARGRPTEIRRNGELVQAFVYRRDGLLASQTDPAGTTTFDYDRAGRQVSVVDPAGRTTTFGYGASDQPTSITDNAGGVTTFEYDAVGRTTAVTDATGRTVRQSYDEMGNAVRGVDAAGLVVETVFEAGRPVRVTSPGGGVRTISYDASGRPVEVVDEEGHTTRTTYDAAGRQATFTDAVGGTTTYVYSAGADLQAVIDPLGRTTRYDHDAAGRVVGITYPDGSTTSMTRDLSGQITSAVDAAGRTSTLTYTDDGDLASVTRSDGSVEQRTYDDAGNLLTAQLDDELVEFTYGPTGSILSTTQPGIGSITYVEDAVGRVAEALVAVEGVGTTTTRYGYDLAGRLTSVDTPEGVTALGYDPGGRLANRATPDGTTSTLSYGPDGLLSALTVADGGNVLLDEQATRDLRGDITRIDRPAGASSTFGFDPARRLLTESHDDGAGGVTAWTYGYDAAGNRITENGPDGNIALEYDVMDRLISRDGQTRRHDVAGNLIAETDGGLERLFAYDTRDQLVGVTDAAGQVTYVVDALGRRTGRDGQGQLIDVRSPTGLSEVVATRDLGGTTTTRTAFADTALSTTGPDGTSFWHPDMLGNAAVVTNAAGAVTDLRAISAFGTLLSRTGTGPLDRLFESQPIDPFSGLTHLRARDYNATTGLFTAVDPLAAAATDPGARMRYAYGLQNPLTYEDLTGLFATLGEVKVTLAIQGAIGAAFGGVIGAVTGKGFLKGAFFGAVSGIVGAAAGLGISAGVAAAATRSAGAQIISRLAEAGLLDDAVAVAAGLADAFTGLATDYIDSGKAPDAITVSVTFIASIGVALGFRNAAFADDFARELDGGIRAVIAVGSDSASAASRQSAFRLRALASQGGLLSIDEVLRVAGPFGVDIVATATREAFAFTPRSALFEVAAIGTEVIKKFLGLIPAGVDKIRGK